MLKVAVTQVQPYDHSLKLGHATCARHLMSQCVVAEQGLKSSPHTKCYILLSQDEPSQWQSSRPILDCHLFSGKMTASNLWGYRNPHPSTQNTVHAAQAQHSSAHLPVAEVQANHELLEDPARVDLQQAAVGLLPQQVLEQVPTLSKLHGNAQMGGREEHLQGSRHSSQGLTGACAGCGMHVCGCWAGAGPCLRLLCLAWDRLCCRWVSGAHLQPQKASFERHEGGC